MKGSGQERGSNRHAQGVRGREGEETNVVYGWVCQMVLKVCNGSLASHNGLDKEAKPATRGSEESSKYKKLLTFSATHNILVKQRQQGKAEPEQIRR